jgi:hypothetical protein
MMNDFNDKVSLADAQKTLAETLRVSLDQTVCSQFTPEQKALLEKLESPGPLPRTG